MMNIMTVLQLILICCVAMETSSLSVDLEIVSRIFLPYTYSPGPQYSLEKDAAEQMAYDFTTRLLYSVGHTNIHVINVSDVTNMQVLFHASENNVDVTDVEVCGDHVFVAMDNLTKREEGFIDVYTTYNPDTQRMHHLQRIIVGDLPDMIQLTKDCSRLVVALEAEPYDDHSAHKLIDNPGAVLIVTFSTTPGGAYNVTTLDFKKFDARLADLEISGVRQVYKGNNNPFSNDVEPEYISFNEDETKAYIALQENNAIAVVDMVNEELESIHGLGYKDWSSIGMDASDKDNGIHFQSWPVYGMYQPDSIHVFKHQGEDFIITANEGDSKDYHYFSEEVRVGEFGLSDLFEPNATIRSAMEEKSALGRLHVTTSNGFNTTSQKFDRLFAFGGRSFSVFRAATMEQVYDSGADIAHQIAAHLPYLFNNGMNPQEGVNETQDSRSDDKGPETESVVLGHFGDVTLVFVGNERPGIVAVYAIDGREPVPQPRFQTLLADIPRSRETWQQLYDKRSLSMIDCEDMKFVPATDSPNGKPLLLVTGSLSGTITVVQINVKQLDTFMNFNGPSPLIAGFHKPSQ